MGSEREASLGKVSGDDSWRAPPVPIPNTEVKPPNADGTELGTAWESRKSPGSKSGSGRNGSFSRSGNERGRDGRKARERSARREAPKGGPERRKERAQAKPSRAEQKERSEAKASRGARERKPPPQ